MVETNQIFTHGKTNESFGHSVTVGKLDINHKINSMGLAQMRVSGD